MDRQTDRHMAIAYTALAQHIAPSGKSQPTENDKINEKYVLSLTM